MKIKDITVDLKISNIEEITEFAESVSECIIPSKFEEFCGKLVQSAIKSRLATGTKKDTISLNQNSSKLRIDDLSTGITVDEKRELTAAFTHGAECE